MRFGNFNEKANFLHIATGPVLSTGGPTSVLKELLSYNMQGDSIYFDLLAYGEVDNSFKSNKEFNLIHNNSNRFFRFISNTITLRTHKRESIFICHGHYLMQTMLIVLLKKGDSSLVEIPHGSIFADSYGSSKIWKKYIFDKIYLSLVFLKKFSIVYVALSEIEKSEIESKFPGAVIHIMKIGFDDKILKSYKAPKKLGASREFGIVSISRFHALKNYEIILNSSSELIKGNFDFKVTFAGDDSNCYGLKIKQLAHELGVMEHISFVGVVDGIEKEELYANSDISILVSWQESFGISALESVCRWRPVIVSRNCGFASIVNSTKCGLTIDPSSPLELSKAIIELAMHYNFYAENCELVREEYSRSSVFQAWRSFYLTLKGVN